MIKYKCGDVNIWVSETGSLNIEAGEDITEIPFEDGRELVSMIRRKQELHAEMVEKKRGVMEKFRRFLEGKNKIEL